MAEKKNNTELVPAGIVEQIIDNVQTSLDRNTVAIEELTTAVNQVANAIVYPPTRKEIENDIKALDESCGKRHESISKSLVTISSRLKTVLLVISIASSLLIISYLFVRATVDSQVNKAVKEVIDTRPEKQKFSIIANKENGEPYFIFTSPDGKMTVKSWKNMSVDERRIVTGGSSDEIK